jgi:DNA mismatch repair protein MutL
MLYSYTNESDEWKEDNHKYLAKNLAVSNSIKTGQELNTPAMNQLIDELFACEMPFVSVHNKPTAIILEMTELLKRFQ